MAWLGKISNLGNLSDFAGAVNKISESVKNIERNFDSALGFEAKSEPSEAPPAAIEKRGQPTEPPVAAVIQSKDVTENGSSQGEPSLLNNVFGFARANFGNFDKVQSHITQSAFTESASARAQKDLKVDVEEVTSHSTGLEEKYDGKETTKSGPEIQSAEGSTQVEISVQPSDSDRNGNVDDGVKEVSTATDDSTVEEPSGSTLSEKVDEIKNHESDSSTEVVVVQQREVLALVEGVEDKKEQDFDTRTQNIVKEDLATGVSPKEEDLGNEDVHLAIPSPQVPSGIVVTESQTHVIGDEEIEQGVGDRIISGSESSVDTSTSSSQPQDLKHSEASELHNGIVLLEETLPVVAEPSHVVRSLESVSEKNEVNKLKEDLKMMEAALQGAAMQSQIKVDEISRLMIENEDLKSSLDDLKKKTSSVELDALREEYQQRVGAAERKVYALTKERDLLRRDQSRKSDSSLLLKEKDEIIKQVMAEGEELSRKQAVQEGTMRKLRAQIRELEEEKQRLNSKLQVEEGKVESIRKDKAVTETALQEAIERGQVELAALRDYYAVALNEAKEAEVRAEARADSEAKADLERRCRESADREATLLQNLDDLRQALSRTEQQAAFREDMHKSDLEDQEKRRKAAEARYEELVANMPDSTRPLRRQIEALQESTAMRAEAWTAIERSLNSRLQEAEAKAAAAQERERAISERLSQTLSRMAVMEAQLSLLRAEQSQSIRSLEKERQRAAESRQEYLAATEMATTQEGRAKQLEEEIQELRLRQKQELKEERAHRHALEQEIDQEKALIADYEKRLLAEGRSVIDKAILPAQPASQSEFSSSNKTHKRLPSVSSAGSVEENFLHASLDSDGTTVQRLSFSDRPPSPYVRGPGASLEQLESQLRQKEGELSSCFQRLASLESTRDSLAEELVRVTTQSESLRTEVGFLPGLRAELDSLRHRHTSALELMGERDEEVEELKADIADVKQMYREQITMLVGQIERLSAGGPNS